MPRRTIVRMLAPPLLALLAASGLRCQGPCPPGWTPGLFNLPGLGPGPVNALAVFDDGTGAALYAGGSLTTLDGTVSRVVRWNGYVWVPAGVLGTAGEVKAFEIFDDGAGPALHAAGSISGIQTGVARWNGATWSTVGGVPGLISANVSTLKVFDDGSGPALWAGGSVSLAPNNAATLVAKLLPSGVWQSAGGAMAGSIQALCVHDQGTGPELYVAGGFGQIGGAPVSHVAKWNGTAWQQVGSGLGPSDVSALHSFDDGTGPALYAGTGYPFGVARWNGASWSGVGSSMPLGTVRGFGIHAGQLCATGSWGVIRWDGVNWTDFSWGTGQAGRALIEFDDGSGNALYCGGSFSPASGTPASSIARWNGTSWSAMVPGQGVGSGWIPSQPQVRCMTVFDDGGGPALYVGGLFTHFGTVEARNLARWDGETWSALGTGTNDTVYALAAFDDGGGPALYLGGAFGVAGGVPVAGLAKWNGASYSAVGGGVSNPSGGVPSVKALATFDDGAGPALYAGGSFTQVGSVPAGGLARWNGTSWSTPASAGPFGVSALLTYDDGTGTALYVGGGFNQIGGIAANAIARWNGSVWDPLGAGLAWVGSAGAVFSLTGWDDGTGPAVYAGGAFDHSAWGPADKVARWSGVSWSALGGGLAFFPFALAGFDDGTGPALYAGGAGANGIQRFDGSSWSVLGGGLSGPGASVTALRGFDDGSGSSLLAGGAFEAAGNAASYCLARWGPQRPKLSFATATGAVTIHDSRLLVGHEYYNIFSGDTCGVIGGGPYLGLCAGNVNVLLGQFALPLGVPPFHIFGVQPIASFGPYSVLSGVTLDGICFDYTGGVVGCVSVARRVHVP